MMKTLVLVLGFFGISWGVFAATTLGSVVGDYKASLRGEPIVNYISLMADGTVILIEESPQRKMKCLGTATVEKGIVESHMACDNNLSFVQRIDLNGVADFSKFTALVYSSLYGMKIEMDFVRI